jgi:energy-coupling factor transport system substrate-specific component
MSTRTKLVSLCIFLICVPAVCVAGVVFFKDRSVSFVCTGVVLVILAGYFYVYEKKSSPAWELVIIALMSALSVLGRIVFAFLPSLKPCSAIIILTDVYFGRERGFMVGAFTALVSNFYFGQGTWTPFQMLAWGLTGYFAGMLGRWLVKNRILLLIYSAAIGVFFSLLMDLYSCLWMDGEVILSRYLVLISSAAWVTVSYAVSNVVFTALFMQPFGRIFKRLCVKYGIGSCTILKNDPKGTDKNDTSAGQTVHQGQ